MQSAPPPPPPPTFPRADWQRAEPFMHPPFDPQSQCDRRVMIAWAARNASTAWEENVQRELQGEGKQTSPSFIQIFILAVCDKVFEMNQWARVVRGWTGYYKTVAEWTAASDALIPPAYNLALAVLPPGVNPPPLDQVGPFARAALDQSFRKLGDADAPFPKETRRVFDLSLLTGLLPVPPPRKPSAHNHPTTILARRVPTSKATVCPSAPRKTRKSVSARSHKLLPSSSERHRRTREAAGVSSRLVADMDRLDIHG